MAAADRSAGSIGCWLDRLIFRDDWLDRLIFRAGWLVRWFDVSGGLAFAGDLGGPAFFIVFWAFLELG